MLLFSQEIYNQPSTNQINNSLVKKQQQLREYKQTIRFLESSLENDTQLLAKENFRKQRLEAKIKIIDDQLVAFNKELSKLKKAHENPDKEVEKRIRKLYRSVVKTTLKLDRQKQKYYKLKDRVRELTTSIDKTKKEIAKRTAELKKSEGKK